MHAFVFYYTVLICAASLSKQVFTPSLTSCCDHLGTLKDGNAQHTQLKVLFSQIRFLITCSHFTLSPQNIEMLQSQQNKELAQPHDQQLTKKKKKNIAEDNFAKKTGYIYKYYNEITPIMK